MDKMRLDYDGPLMAGAQLPVRLPPIDKSTPLAFLKSCNKRRAAILNICEELGMILADTMNGADGLTPEVIATAHEQRMQNAYNGALSFGQSLGLSTEEIIAGLDRLKKT